MAALTTIAAVAGALAAVGGTAYSIASRPKTPDVPVPPPTPVPPPPTPAPPPPTPAQAETGVADEAAKLRRKRGLAATVLTSPLGIATASDKLGA